MSENYILYNPLAGCGNAKEEAGFLMAGFLGEYDADYEAVDITKVNDFSKMFAGMTEKDKAIICGGDGTLNHFINKTKNIKISCKILYYPCGTGNDFLHDIEKTEYDCPVEITKYIKDLPTAKVKGVEYKFLNNVSFGIDGYCCEVGDTLKAKGKKNINYTNIAIRGLLFNYKPTNATVIVDGKEYNFKKVWLAPTMKGKYLGGGMMAAPSQDRLDEGRNVSIMIFHNAGKLKTLCYFPSIFKGTHVKKDKNVTILTGKNVKVKFDSPRAVQIDGETIRNVGEYEVVV